MDRLYKGSFDSDVICIPCSGIRGRDVYCPTAQATASERPFAIVCPKCNTNYMELVNKMIEDAQM